MQRMDDVEMITKVNNVIITRVQPDIVLVINVVSGRTVSIEIEDYDRGTYTVCTPSGPGIWDVLGVDQRPILEIIEEIAKDLDN